MKLKRQLFTGILGLATLCGCLGTFVFSNSNIAPIHADAVSEIHSHDNITFQPWESSTSLPTSGSYYLTCDIVCSSGDSYASVLTGDLNLCLNGWLIKTNNKLSVFYVGVNKTLKIYDCNSTNQIHYYRIKDSNDWILDSYSSTAIPLDQVTLNTQQNTIVSIPGGSIVDISNNRGVHATYGEPYGAAIKVDGSNANLFLYSGNIVGGYCDYGGGAIALEDGASFTMEGGRIVGNCGYEAGGIFSRSGCTFIMKDGLIAHNVARYSYGGGVVSFGNTTINGGSISFNRTKQVDKDSNNRNGGGVFVANGTFTLNDGAISNNYSFYNGGGVEVHAGSFVMNGGSIIENRAANGGGGINNNNRTTIINGGTIKSNNCSNGIGHQIRNDGGSASMSGYCTVDNARNSAANYDLYYVTTNTKTKILLNKQGGKGGWDYNDPQSFGQWMNTSSTLVPIRNGCTFLGYFDAPSGGTQYYKQDGNPAKTWDKIVAETTLYAQWDPATYLVTFDKQGGTGGSDSSYISNFDSSSANNDQITIPQITGYTFLGYFDQPNGQGNQVYNASGEFIKGNKSTYANKTLYANWTASTYTVSLDFQGGTGGTTQIIPTYDAEMPSITLPTRDYCDFGGYFTGINGDGTQYYNAEGTSARNWDLDSNTTLYAYWIKTIENFSKEFLVKTTTGNYCDKTKGIDLDKSIQDDLFTSFSMVDSDGKTTFKNAEWIRGHSQIYENDIVEAKSRYCYMVVELGINDFLNLFTKDELKALMHRRSIVSLFNDGEDGTSIILVASLSILAITTISAYILFRKRKEE